MIVSFMASLDPYFSHSNDMPELLIGSKMRELVESLLHTDQSQDVRDILCHLFSEKEFSFREIVDAHLLQPVGIEAMAQLTHCSVSTFQRQFKSIYGSSPARYLMEVRLDAVAKRLSQTDETVRQIGYRYGFENPEHLSRAFKKHFGTSPSAYRMTKYVMLLTETIIPSQRSNVHTPCLHPRTRSIHAKTPATHLAVLFSSTK